MAFSKKQISAERLCDAAEAALTAIAEVGKGEGNEWPYPLELLDRREQPDCLLEFERWEIQQASEFLVRLGMIHPPVRKKGFW